MTGPDSQDTRPISVAELLARNGTIGAPPVGGRRRRRRGNTNAVTVAELTGEIPIVRPEDVDVPDVETPTNGTNGTVEAPPEPQAGEAPAEPQAGEAPAEPEAAVATTDGEVTAEQMVPDPVEGEVADEDEDAAAEEAAVVDEHPEKIAEPPSYLHAMRDPLFGGPLEEDLRHDEPAYYDEVTELPEVPPETTTAEDHEERTGPNRIEQIGRGVLVVLQSMLAVAVGAGLFIGFDQLWKWNKIIALVLSVLVILGLVVGVRIVRKTEDITSTLIAVAVGALVTLGPLALLQSG
ncbi:MAG: hypothetical protein JO191_13710 [Mycobacteriaceae bacterium]|nr:hypothetical protein [Mycobacteriaceae bacterium]